MIEDDGGTIFATAWSVFIALVLCFFLCSCINQFARSYALEQRTASSILEKVDENDDVNNALLKKKKN